jgi:hypothetical protein
MSYDVLQPRCGHVMEYADAVVSRVTVEHRIKVT